MDAAESSSFTRVGVAEVVAEDRLTPLDLPVDRLRVRVEEQLAGVEACAGGWIVLAVDAVAIALPGAHLWKVRVPDERVDVDHVHARLLAAVSEEAQLDALGAFTEQREVRSVAVEGRAERVARTGPGLHIASIVRSIHGGVDRPDLSD